MAISSTNKEITDNELLHLYKSDKNSSALSVLFERYKPLIISRIKSFGISNVEFDDAFQECMIVLFSAINHYNQQIASFNTYVSVCINRVLISIYRQNKKGGEILSSNIDLSESDLAYTNSENPQYIIENNFNYFQLIETVKSSLSSLEFSVLKYLFAGHKYSEIAKALSISLKSVDNAVQRIRNKFNNIYMPE